MAKVYLCKVVLSCYGVIIFVIYYNHYTVNKCKSEWIIKFLFLLCIGWTLLHAIVRIKTVVLLEWNVESCYVKLEWCMYY
jgi:hypothetical protein